MERTNIEQAYEQIRRGITDDRWIASQTFGTRGREAPSPEAPRPSRRRPSATRKPPARRPAAA